MVFRYSLPETELISYCKNEFTKVSLSLFPEKPLLLVDY